MSPQLILIIVLVLALAAYWRLALSLLLAGTVILLLLGMIHLGQLLHLATNAA